MPLLTYEQMEDDVDATANLWNVRFGRLHDLVNGRLDQANLANGAVTTAKLANSSVTSAKLNLAFGYDDNGWQVFDFGPFKRYVRLTETVAGGSANFDNIPYPVGVDLEAVREVSVSLIARADNGTGDWGRSFISCRLNADDITAFRKMDNESNVFPDGLLQIVIVA